MIWSWRALDRCTRNNRLKTYVKRAPERARDELRGRSDTLRDPEVARRGGDALQRKSSGLSNTDGSVLNWILAAAGIFLTTRKSLMCMS